MDEFLRNWIYKKYSVGRFEFTVLELLLAFCITGTGVLLREAVVDWTPVTAAKLEAIAADYAMALLAAAFVRERTGGRSRALLTYALFVVWPVFAANSALLGEGGSFMGALLILALLCYDRDRKLLSVLALAGGLILWIRGLPSPGPKDLLTLGWPNIFELTGKIMFIDLYGIVSWLFIAGILLCTGYCMWKMKVRVTPELFLPLLLFFAVFFPYFAPFMPAWAGYGADVLALLLALLYPKMFYVPMLHLIVSYSAYAYVLNGETKLPMVTYSVILFALLLLTGAHVYEIMREQTQKGAIPGERD